MDPIEDAVTLSAVDNLKRVAVKLLLSVGFGADLFNHVLESANFWAVADLKRSGGFRRTVGLDPLSEGFEFYRGALNHIYEL